jgi:hypothetical protein
MVIRLTVECTQLPFDGHTGKTTFFVVNQCKLDCLPAEEIATLETDLKVVEEQNKALAVGLKNASAGRRSAGLLYALNR